MGDSSFVEKKIMNNNKNNNNNNNTKQQQQQQQQRLLNPWVLHIHKLGLELKCPLCLNLFVQPKLLPCNHIFCCNCLPNSAQSVSVCPLCDVQYSAQDLRPAPYMENIVSIYRNLDATFNANLISRDAGRIPDASLIAAIGETIQGFSKEANRITRAGPAGDGTTEMDITHAENECLGTPPTLSDTKGMEDDNSDRGSEHTPMRYSAKRPVKEGCDDRASSERDRSSLFRYESHVGEVKRQKKLNYATSPEFGVNNNSQSGPVSGPEADTKLQADINRAKSYNCKTPCAFCQSTKVSEFSGEMLHYLNGNPAQGDEVFNSSVIHVHEKCIEWAPQVYFEGDIVKNLEKELARGAKLKCCICGLKGAALGCYAKSCRKTYHAPCSAELPDCRWDYENFLMLCPAHISCKFPNEKSKPCVRNSKNLSLATPNSSQSEVSRQPASGEKTLVLCGSALSPEEKSLLLKFATMIGVKVSKLWSPDVTHVIAATDQKEACTRTFKVLMAISHGRWVLKIDWLKACLEARHLVSEEPYEVCLDNHGCSNGPKLGRLRAIKNEQKLFNGLRFYFAADFVPAFVQDLQHLVIAAGGSVLKSKESLFQGQDGHDALKTMIVYNPEPPQGCQLGEELSIYWQKLNEAEELAASSGAKVINHTWLLESIAACKLQPLVSLTTPFAQQMTA